MRIDALQAQRVLVDGAFRPATVLVHHGRIEAIEPVEHEVDGVVLRAPDTAYVVPGIVDTHVHINEPGRTHWEGFVSATEAAALGGATTLVDMPLNSIPPTTTMHGLRAKQAAAAGELMVDVGFWGGVHVGPDAPRAPRNRAIEAQVHALGGHKSLYSEAFYDRETFDHLYDGAHLAQVKRRYDPDDRLTPLYDKAVKRR